MKGKFSLKSINVYYCGKEQCQPGHFFGPAVRPHFLIHFILDGKGYYEVRGEKHYLQRGDAFLICPGESTFYAADAYHSWHYAWIAIGGTEIEKLLEMAGLDQEHLIYHPPSSDSLQQQHLDILTLIDMFLKNDYNEPALLSAFYRVFSHMTIKDIYEEPTPQKLYFQDACTYIHNNYGYDIHILDIAHYIGIERSYLYKIFMKEKNLSPQQYLLQYRLDKSTNMLLDTSLTITEVALSCGFKNISSFSKHFKSYKGISPRQYKKGMIYFQ